MCEYLLVRFTRLGKFHSGNGKKKAEKPFLRFIRFCDIKSTLVQFDDDTANDSLSFIELRESVGER
ncbi:MAG TPA: hypothetical protein DHV12_02465 [Thermotogae bacterium]|nr:hypothetical protein [Thermotogota bacterium]